MSVYPVTATINRHSSLCFVDFSKVLVAIKIDREPMRLIGGRIKVNISLSTHLNCMIMILRLETSGFPEQYWGYL